MNGNGRFGAPFYLMEVQNRMFYYGLMGDLYAPSKCVSGDQVLKYASKRVGLRDLLGVVGAKLSSALVLSRRWILDDKSKLYDVRRAKDAVMYEHGPEPLSRRVSP